MAPRGVPLGNQRNLLGTSGAFGEKCPILSKVHLLFLLSPLLPPLLISARSSSSALPISSSLPSAFRAVFTQIPGKLPSAVRAQLPFWKGQGHTLVVFKPPSIFASADRGGGAVHGGGLGHAPSSCGTPVATVRRKQLLFPGGQRCLCPRASGLNHPLFTGAGEEKKSKFGKSKG